MTGETVTKTQARASIREARQALRNLELALKENGPMRDYVRRDGEPLAMLVAPYYDTVEALGGEF